MARVTNPLLSQEARGSVGQALTFNRVRGQNVVKAYTRPSNPRSAAQQANRIGFRVARLYQPEISRDAYRWGGAAISPLTFFRQNRRTEETYASAAQRLMYPSGGASFAEDVAFAMGLSAAVQGAYRTANEALDVPFTNIPASNGIAAITGNVAFVSYLRGLQRAGYIEAAIGDVPPARADN